MKEEIILIGGGGHAKVIIDALKGQNKFSIFGILDNNIPAGKDVLGIKVLGDDSLLEDLFEKGIKKAFICVGSVGDVSTRQKIYKRVKAIGYELPYIIHPQAYVADSIFVGEGSFLAAGVIINPGTKIGKNVIINTKASVDHDCDIGDFVHIAPGSILGGNINIGNNVHVGMGAIVVQGVVIKENAFIKARELVK